MFVKLVGREKYVKVDDIGYIHPSLSKSALKRATRSYYNGYGGCVSHYLVLYDIDRHPCGFFNVKRWIKIYPKKLDRVEYIRIFIKKYRRMFHSSESLRLGEQEWWL